MSEFDPVIDAQLSGATVVMALLVEVEFVSETYRLWTGVGTRTFGEKVWEGVGALASLSDVSRLQNGEADPFEIVLSGNDELIQLALVNFATEAQGQPIAASLQFLNFTDESPLGPPWLLREGTMVGAALTVEDTSLALTVKCDTLASGRNRPPFGRLTARDQRARYPDDRGLDSVHKLNGSEIVWPDF